uniref:HORMA domain-containing protein n=1 Tax=Anopheles atroparvus TaxID=41427 RepID=A0A182IUA1_ANOAO
MTTQTNSINLKGSAQIITQYLHYGINSILFQRGIYPPEEFVFKEEYGITILVSKNKKILEFLENILKKVEEWLPHQKLERISMVLIEISSRKTLERWDFTIAYEDDNHTDENSQQVSNKSLKQIQSEIRNVMRQITSSISFLPLIENRATFDVLLHPKKSEYANEIPSEWEWRSASDITIANSQSVNMRSFSTGFDKVDTAVVYRMIEE